MFGNKRTKIDADLFRQAREAADEAGYSSVRELIEHAIEKRIREVKRKPQADQKSVEERLRGLGYIA